MLQFRMFGVVRIWDRKYILYYRISATPLFAY